MIQIPLQPSFIPKHLNAQIPPPPHSVTATSTLKPIHISTMNAPLTPHPTSFPPTVDATILYSLSLLKLSNLDAINDLIKLKSNRTVVIEKSTLSLRINYLRNSRSDSAWSKRAVREELERNLARETVNLIADMDEGCVAVLRKVCRVKFLGDESERLVLIIVFFS